MQTDTRGAFGIGKYADWMAPGAVGFASRSGTGMARASAGTRRVLVGELARQN